MVITANHMHFDSAIRVDTVAAYRFCVGLLDEGHQKLCFTCPRNMAMTELVRSIPERLVASTKAWGLLATHENGDIHIISTSYPIMTHLRGSARLAMFDSSLYLPEKTNLLDVHNQAIINARVASAQITSSPHKSNCPLCGGAGDDLVFKFYCTNPACRNWSK